MDSSLFKLQSGFSELVIWEQEACMTDGNVSAIKRRKNSV